MWNTRFRKVKTFILGFFPIKPASFEDFIDLLQREESPVIIAKPIVDDLDAPEHEDIGRVGTLKCIIELKAMAENGRPILWTQNLPYLTRVGSTKGAADQKVRVSTQLKHFAETVKLLQWIASAVPGIKPIFLGNGGKPMDPEMYEQLYGRAL